MNIKDFNPSIIPNTEEKESIQEMTRSIYELFIQDFIQEFIKGFETQQALTKFQEWCITNGHDAGKPWQFRKEMLEHCRTYRPSNPGGIRKYFYVLKNDEYNNFKIPQ